MRHLKQVVVVALAGLFTTPTSARASGFVSLPGGAFGYEFDYTTGNAAFSCNSALTLPTGTTCVGGSTLTLTSASGSVTIGFSGTTGTGLAPNYGTAVPFSLGAVTQVVTGTFAYPLGNPPAQPVAFMSFQFSSGGSTATRSGSMFPNGPTQFTWGPRLEVANYWGIAAPGLPANIRQGILANYAYVGGGQGTNLFNVGAASTTIFATASLLPEPSTYALLGTGLLVIGAVARRRRA